MKFIVSLQSFSLIQNFKIDDKINQFFFSENEDSGSYKLFDSNSIIFILNAET
jgi:hypothetical protein